MPTEKNIPAVNFHFLRKRFSFSNSRNLKAFIFSLFKKEKKKLGQLDYIFCGDEYLLQINKAYLNHNFYTDIITFDLSENKNKVTGEIYISIDRVKENALTYRTSFREELHRVILHGALHLCGYGDKTKSESEEMRRMEDKYLSLFFDK
jgi:probable rRNA maturation factor